MSRAEDPILRELEYDASAVGEIHSITTDSIEIRGIFTPGQSLTLRPGVKVFILTADDAIELLTAYAGTTTVEVVGDDIHAPKPKEAGGGK